RRGRYRRTGAGAAARLTPTRSEPWTASSPAFPRSSAPGHRTSGMSKSRVEAFSDGVFAIAITLLVLTIAEPSDYGHLGSQLWDRWPSLAAYVVSFLVIGIMWLNHHSVFNHFERIDRPLVYLNQLLLLTVVFLPYPTGVLGEALRQGEGTQVAALVYTVTMAINAYCWAALWLYASSGRRLLGVLRTRARAHRVPPHRGGSRLRGAGDRKPAGQGLPGRRAVERAPRRRPLPVHRPVHPGAPRVSGPPGVSRPARPNSRLNSDLMSAAPAGEQSCQRLGDDDHRADDRREEHGDHRPAQGDGLPHHRFMVSRRRSRQTEGVV